MDLCLIGGGGGGQSAIGIYAFFYMSNLLGYMCILLYMKLIGCNGVA